MNYVLVTNHASALLERNSPLRACVASATDDLLLSLSRPSVGELWFMVFNSARVSENRVKLEELLNECPVVEFDAAASFEYGRIRAEPRRAGRPIPAIDAMIAATARANAATVLSADRHFDVVRGIKAENWLS